MNTSTSSPALRDGQHDFDFIFGSWNVHHRRLVRPLTGSNEWYEFDGTSVQRPVWGGKANLEEQDLHSPLGRFEGLALRLYDQELRQWSIYWGTVKDGLTTVPMIGSFTDGVGEFLDREIFEGTPIMCRYLWSHSSPSQARWEQAFSTDDGITWETNWTMDFTRA
ncbi:MAG TPA: hypothetical protein VGN11_00740 [Candidatus Baltobacteraceae bacterium]|jgi:hypothetical protein|nr:hypothetical protein [Candidatus Baltobacteraceae bacterium]